MRNKSLGFLHHSVAVSAAVRHKTGNFGSLNTVRGTPTSGMSESVSAKAYQCLWSGVIRSRAFCSSSKRIISIMIKCFTLLFAALAFSLSVQAAAPTCGLTIITHGYQSEFETDGSLPQWVRKMADAINKQVGATMPIYRVRYDKRWTITPEDDEIILEDGDTSIDISGGAIILLDWVGISNEPLIYSTEGIASRFFDFLFSTGCPRTQ